jgi:hypothetical protein
MLRSGPERYALGVTVSPDCSTRVRSFSHGQTFLLVEVMEAVNSFLEVSRELLNLLEPTL